MARLVRTRMQRCYRLLEPIIARAQERERERGRCPRRHRFELPLITLTGSGTEGGRESAFYWRLLQPIDQNLLHVRTRIRRGRLISFLFWLSTPTRSIAIFHHSRRLPFSNHHGRYCCR